MKTPHLLLASSNCQKLRNNLAHLVDSEALASIDKEIARNAAALFGLGLNHFNTAKRFHSSAWRHAISRYYYAAYHVGRTVRFFVDGVYSTDATDHKKISALPPDFPQLHTYATKLELLRDNRNLCDYDHEVKMDELVMSRKETRELVADFIDDARAYLKGRGLQV